jgi:hypothetical protein
MYTLELYSTAPHIITELMESLRANGGCCKLDQNVSTNEIVAQNTTAKGHDKGDQVHMLLWVCQVLATEAKNG